MVRAMTLEPQGAADWTAAIAAMVAVLGMAGAALKWLWSAGTGRDRRIADREERYIAKVEQRLGELDERLQQIERDYGVVVGVAHVMIDELNAARPANPSLALVAAKIREAYPLLHETPSELLHLLHRLDAAGYKGGRE